MKGTSRRPRVALYARISTHDQQTLPLRIKTMREYAVRRGWQIAAEINEVGSGALQRPKSIGRSLTAHNTKWPILNRIVAIPREGCRNIMLLWQELRERGFEGQSSTVRAWLRQRFGSPKKQRQVRLRSDRFLSGINASHG